MESEQFEVRSEQLEEQSEQLEEQSEQSDVQSAQLGAQSELLKTGGEDFFENEVASTSSKTSGITGKQVASMASSIGNTILTTIVTAIADRNKAENEALYQQAIVDLRNNATHLAKQISNQTHEIVDLYRHTAQLKYSMANNFNITVDIWRDFAYQTEVMENKFLSVEAALNVVLSRIDRAKREIIQYINGVEKEIIDAEHNKPKMDAISQLKSTFNEIIVKANVYSSFTVLEKVANIENTSPESSIVRWEMTRVPEPGESMFNSLWDIVNRGWAVPANSKDSLSLGTLQMLCYGMQMYLFILHYLVQQFTDLAQYYYGQNNFDKYNQYYLRSLNVFNDFSNTLIGESGFFPKVTSVLRQVKRLYFIRRDRLDVEKFVSVNLDSLNRMRSLLKDLGRTMLIVAPDMLDPQLNFTVSDIKTFDPTASQKFHPWTKGSKVSYAIQLLGTEGQPSSMISKWTPGYTLVDKANPTVKVYTDPLKRTRVVFRRFNEGEAQIVAVLKDPDQDEFRDIGRDLFDYALEANPSASLPKVQYYIEHGADVNALLDGDQLAIHAAAKREDHWKVAAELIKHGAHIDVQDANGFTPLYIAARNDNFAFVKNLLEQNANVTLASNERNHQLTALHVAAYKGSSRIVDVLLKAKSIDVNARSTEGFTALHFAAAFNQEPVVSQLLADSRTEIDPKTSLRFIVPPYLKLYKNLDKVASILASSTNVTPLHLAYAYGGEKVVSLLLAKGADIHARTTDGSTVMHFAALNNNAALIPESAQLDNIVNSPNIHDITPLYIAYQHNHYEISQKLIKYGADINVRLSNQKTMLHIAVQCEDENVAHTLIDNAVSVDATDLNGNQALHYALWLRSKKMVDLLFKNKADPNVVHKSTGIPLVHSAFYLDKFETYDMIKLFMSAVIHKLNVNIPDSGSNTLLHIASALGYKSLVELLTKDKEIKIDAPNDNNQTPLHVALKMGHADVANYLFDKMNASVTVYGEGDWTAVNYAIAGPLDSMQTVEFVEKFLPITKECDMVTPDELYIILPEKNLFQASEYDKFEVVKFYGEHCEWLKADLDFNKRGGCIHFDFIRKICSFGNVDVFNYLYKISDEVYYYTYEGRQIPVFDALSGNTKIEIIRYLDSEHYKLATDDKLENEMFHDETNWHALNYTIMGKGDRQIIEYITEHSDGEILLSKLHAPYDEKENLMHLAAKSNKTQMAQFLLEKKVDLNAVDKDGYSPLHIAARNGNADMVKLLVDNGAKVNEKNKNKDDATPLIEAVWHEGNLDVVEYLYWHNAEIELKAPWLLVNRAVQLDKTQIAIFLCEKMEETDCARPNSDKETPLHFAAMNNNLLLVEYFIKLHVYVDSPATSSELTPLHYAIEHQGQLEVVKYLHTKKADIKSVGKENLISLAISKGKYDIAHYLIDAGGDVQTPGNSKRTPLHEAVFADQMDLIQHLIEKGADYTAQDGDGKTPIDWIFMHQKDSALQYFMFNYEDKKTGGSLLHQRTLDKDWMGVEWMVQRGRDVNSQDNQKNTPVHLAAQIGDLNVARELVQSKCLNLSIKNADGKTALDLAEDNKFDDIVTLLKHTSPRSRRDISAVESESVQSVASSASKSFGLINQAIGSLVSTVRSLPVQLSNLMSFKVDKFIASSSARQSSAFHSVQSPDLNSTLLLLDVLIRRHSGERYVDTTVEQSVSPHEARTLGLSLVDQLDKALTEIGDQSGEDATEFNLFDFYRSVERLLLSGRYDQIEPLMHSTAREAFAQSKIESNLIDQLVSNLWTQICAGTQHTEPNLAAMHSLSHFSSAQTAPKVHSERVLITGQNLI